MDERGNPAATGGPRGELDSIHAAFMAELDKASGDRRAVIEAADLAYERAVDAAWQRRSRRLDARRGRAPELPGAAPKDDAR